MTQSVMQALLARFDKWPEDELIGFGVDPDGEVRGLTDITNDFYPEIPVHYYYRVEGVYAGDEEYNVIVTRQMFEENEAPYAEYEACGDFECCMAHRHN